LRRILRRTQASEIPADSLQGCRPATEPMLMQANPVLFVDIDGVISLWGFEYNAYPEGAFHNVDGVMHFLSRGAGNHLLALSERFELVWASGWEDRANDHLLHVLGLPRELPFLSFDRNPGRGHGHWKLPAIEAYAGPRRPVAWIDDAHDDACRAWAAARRAPTVLVATAPAIGLTSDHVARLLAWADGRG
jgi:HAD domain in Swiss Army Knife RNA repair proteins